jgi:hypothetical protein
VTSKGTLTERAWTPAQIERQFKAGDLNLHRCRLLADSVAKVEMKALSLLLHVRKVSFRPKNA